MLLHRKSSVAFLQNPGICELFGVFFLLIFSLCVGGDTIRERQRELFGFWDLLLVWDWLVLLHGWILLLFIEGVDCWGLKVRLE